VRLPEGLPPHFLKPPDWFRPDERRGDETKTGGEKHPPLLKGDVHLFLPPETFGAPQHRKKVGHFGA